MITRKLSNSRTALLIFLLALLVRGAAIQYWKNLELSSDASEYMELAYHLRAFGTFGFAGLHQWAAPSHWPSGPGQPSIARAPGYPAFIASLWWNPATSPTNRVRSAQAILGAATAALVCILAGPFAGIAMSFAPMSVYYSALIMSECLCAFLTILGIWLWARARYWWAGVVLGLATLTKPLTLPLFVIFFVYGLCWRQKKYFAIGAAALAVIAPWTIRNYAVSGKFVPVNAYGWSSNIFFSTIPVPYGSGNPWPLYASDPVMADLSGVPEVEAEKIMLRIAVERIRRHPFSWIWSRIQNYPRAFWDTGTYLTSLLPQTLVKWILVPGNLIFCLLVLYGFEAKADYIWVPLVYSLAAQFPSAGGDRYLLPVVPLMVVSASNGAIRIWKRMRERLPSSAQARSAA